MSKFTLCSQSLAALTALCRDCQVIYRFSMFVCTSLHFLLIYNQIHLSHHSLDEIRAELTAPASGELQKTCSWFAFSYVCVEVLPESGLDEHLMGALLLRRKKRLKFLNFVILLIKLIAKETSPGEKEIPLGHMFR